MKKLAIAILISALVLFGMALGWRYLFLGRLTLPTTQEYTAIARKNQSIVQAAYDYRAEHGIWPQGFGDLVPCYLPTHPSDPLINLSNGILSIHAGVPHTYVCYSFRAGQEGWSADGDFGVGALPLPKGASTRPTLTGDDLVRARLAEYDRRIQRIGRIDAYFIRYNYTQKITYLVSLNRKADAIEVCRAAAKVYPDWWRPPMTIAVLASPAEAALAEADLRAWVEEQPTFVHYWYLCHYYREQGRDHDAVAALQQATKHSLADTDPDGGWVPDAYAFDAARYACEQRQPELVLEITRLWEQPRGVYTYHNDNLHAFRAAAELALGRFDEAKADLDRVVKAGKTQGLWASNLDQLQRAVMAKDSTFIYDAGRLPSGWMLFPSPE